MPGARRHDFDILIASDLRFPGGNSASIVEEVKAQAAAGYTTGLLHLPIASAPARPFNPGIRWCIEEGLATLVIGEQPISARLAVVRNPMVFQGEGAAPGLERVTVDVAAVIVNQPPEDDAQEQPYYDLKVAAERMGSVSARVRWYPIGPLVRQSIEPYQGVIDVASKDWVNVIDVDEWAAPRERFVGDRPVIGRHSRPNYKKWPNTAEAILAAYPDDGRYEVRVLGGAKDPARVLGTVPPAWTVYEFNAVSPRTFLAGLDFFVYYHHPGWIEAFGRAILEALASGAVAIVPPHFRPLFGDACVYAEISDVQATIDRFYGDWPTYRAQSERGQAYARAHFGQSVHVRRLEELIGPPSGSRRPYRRSPVSAADRVLFMSSNGVGVGHLMRLLSMARRAGSRVQPIFFTLSSALGMVRQEGWPVEHLPTRTRTHWRGEEWNAILEERLTTLIDLHQPSAFVFDGTNPYDGLVAVRARYPDLPFVWSRRGMWKAGTGAEMIERRNLFDLIIEPGEVAAALDVGATTQDSQSVVRVNPILLLDEADLLEAADAKRSLDLDPDRPAVLVQLGAGNVGDVHSVVRIVVDRLLEEPGLQVCVAQAAIAQQGLDGLANVRFISIFPLSRYLRAFDFAVLAAGYNSFHESVAFAVPTIFVPNPDMPTDDQPARARYAQEHGFGLCLDPFDAVKFGEMVTAMRKETTRQRLAERCRVVWPGNGAGQAMAAIERLLAESRRRVA